LAVLLRHGEVNAAQAYRRMLNTLGDDVRAHLSLAASVLAELRPARPSGRRSLMKRRRSTCPNPPNIDGVLIQWGDRLFYPGNRHEPATAADGQGGG
jgi:hypothetical protein